VDPAHLGAAADLVRRRRAGDVAPLDALAGPGDEAVRAAPVGREEGQAAARVDGPAPEPLEHPLGHPLRPLPVGLEQQELVLVRAVGGEHVPRPQQRGHDPARRLGGGAGGDVQADHGEGRAGRRRALALLLEPPLEVGVRRQAPDADHRPAPLDHERGPADGDRLAREHHRAPPGRDQLAAQPGPVHAAEILDLERGAHVQAGVVAGRLRVVEADVVLAVAPDRDHPLLGQGVHGEQVRPHDDQVEDAVLDGTLVHLADGARPLGGVSAVRGGHQGVNVTRTV